MAVCDQLEGQQRDRDNQQSALARAALARFADAPNLANLAWLFHDSYIVAPNDLHSAILMHGYPAELPGCGAAR